METCNHHTSDEATVDITSVHPNCLKKQDGQAVGTEAADTGKEGVPSGPALRVVTRGPTGDSRVPLDQPATSAGRADRAQQRRAQGRPTVDRYRRFPASSGAHDNRPAIPVAESQTVDPADAQLAGAQADGLNDESQRSRLLDALLGGRRFDQWSLWELADYLRLPSNGPFVVIAAQLPESGGEALPGIESKLRSLDVYSAWRLYPELQVGIACPRTDDDQKKVLALLSRMATTPVGVSARFNDLEETCQALRYARITLRGRREPGRLVSVFDASLLASAAVSAPEVMTQLVAPMLARFRDLTDDEREILFRTFSVWAETGGSPRSAAQLLFCHPNTVRYRLRRIEQRTGRSLSRPRDIAELCLAFEVHRRLL